jgi:hypothetical protein
METITTGRREYWQWESVERGEESTDNENNYKGSREYWQWKLLE